MSAVAGKCKKNWNKQIGISIYIAYSFILCAIHTILWIRFWIALNYMLMIIVIIAPRQSIQLICNNANILINECNYNAHESHIELKQWHTNENADGVSVNIHTYIQTRRMAGWSQLKTPSKLYINTCIARIWNCFEAIIMKWNVDCHPVWLIAFGVRYEQIICKKNSSKI